MRILLLTFYFPPDLSAGSYRAHALAEALCRAEGGDVDVHVVTTLPNRYSSYRCDLPAPSDSSEVQGRLSIRRLPVRRHRSGLLDQSLAFVGFARRALGAVGNEHFDIVVATSSRLFTAFLGAIVARRTGARLYLDVRDLFLENVRDMFASRLTTTLLAPVLSLVERWTFRQAFRINVVSEGFREYCERRSPQHRVSVFGNGIDPEFLDEQFDKAPGAGPKIIVYAGNIGLGQGMEEIVPRVALRLGPGYQLRIIGDGGRRTELERRLKEAGAHNVRVLPPVDRAGLKQEYRQADYLFLHLNAFPSLETVVPSKLFEYAATGKPIVAGVRGHAADFIRKHVPGAAVFEPLDVEGMATALESFSGDRFDRDEFRTAFARTRIMDAMAADILRR